MPTPECVPCTIAPCLPEDDFFIPAPPVPPPGPSEQLRICNDELTGECPYGETGYPVTISAGTFCTTIQFPAQTPPSQQLIDVIKGKMNAAAQAQLEARLAEGCHTEPPPPPVTSCISGIVWDAPTIFQSGVGVVATCVTSTGANFMEATITVFFPAGLTTPPDGASATVTGRFQYTRTADAPGCQFRVTQEVISSTGVFGQSSNCNWDASICETAFPFECFPNIGYGWNIPLGGPQPLGTTNFGPFQAGSFYTGQIDILFEAFSNSLFVPGDVDTGTSIRFRIEKV